MPRKRTTSEKKSTSSGISQYTYFVMLFFFMGFSVIIYVTFNGIIRTVGLPSYLATALRGTTILTFLFMGLILVRPLFSK